MQKYDSRSLLVGGVVLPALFLLMAGPASAGIPSQDGPKIVAPQVQPGEPSTVPRDELSELLDETWNLDKNGVPLQGKELFEAAQELSRGVNEFVQRSHCYHLLLDRMPGDCMLLDRSIIYDFPGFRQHIECKSGGSDFLVVSKNILDELTADDGEFFCEDNHLAFAIEKEKPPTAEVVLTPQKPRSDGRSSSPSHPR